MSFEEKKDHISAEIDEGYKVCTSKGKIMRGFPVGSVVKNPPADTGDAGLIPEWGRSPGGGNGNPLQ